MKTAKEWAAETITDPSELDEQFWNVSLRDEQAPPGISLIEPSGEDDARDLCADARGIIERLVERVQADARAPLEEEIARLRVENDRLNAEHVDYRAFIANANDMLAEEHEQIGKANQ
jgi:hypothetical protein